MNASSYGQRDIMQMEYDDAKACFDLLDERLRNPLPVKMNVKERYDAYVRQRVAWRRLANARDAIAVYDAKGDAA